MAACNAGGGLLNSAFFRAAASGAATAEYAPIAFSALEQLAFSNSAPSARAPGVASTGQQQQQPPLQSGGNWRGHLDSQAGCGFGGAPLFGSGCSAGGSTGTTPSSAAKHIQEETPPKLVAPAASVASAAAVPPPAWAGGTTFSELGREVPQRQVPGTSYKPTGTWGRAPPRGNGSGAKGSDESLRHWPGTLEVELLGLSGFQLVAGSHMPKEAWESICEWPGAKKQAKGKWRFPADSYPAVSQRLHQYGFVARCSTSLPPPWVLVSIPPFQAHGQVEVKKKVAHVVTAKAPFAPLPAEIRSRDGLSLLPYQREALEFAVRRGGRVLLGDEMGLGKTAQALALMAQYARDWPLLVVCPSSVRSTWRDEAARWLPAELVAEPDKEVQVVRKGSDEYRPEAKLFIVSYDLAAKHAHYWTAPGGKAFNMIVCDEAHYLKTPTSQRSRSLRPLLQQARRCVLLSGTPALGKAAELFSPLDCLLPGLLPPYEDFCERYCDKKVIQVGRRQVTQWIGSRMGHELQALLESTVMIRRCKADVLAQLPDKRRQRVFLEKTSSPEMKELEGKLRERGAELAAQLDKGDEGGSIGSNAMELFRLTAVAKIKPVQEYVDYLVQADCRFLLFAHHTAVMDALEETIKRQRARFIRIDGGTPARQREELVEQFQNNDTIQVALLSITACGTGLNLQCCSTVVFAELHWTPGVLMQAEDRVHRMGQKHSVNVHYLIARGTLDEQMFKMLERKHLDVGVLLDGAAASIGAHHAHGRVGAYSTTGGEQIDLGGSGSGRGLKRSASNVTDPGLQKGQRLLSTGRH